MDFYKGGGEGNYDKIYRLMPGSSRIRAAEMGTETSLSSQSIIKWFDLAFKLSICRKLWRENGRYISPLLGVHTMTTLSDP